MKSQNTTNTNPVKKISKFLKPFYLLKWNTKAFFKNPREFIKNYITDFKTLDLKGKVIKILMTAAGTAIVLFLIREAIILFFALIFMAGLISSSLNIDIADDTLETLKANYRSRHNGCDAQSLNDLYRG